MLRIRKLRMSIHLTGPPLNSKPPHSAKAKVRNLKILNLMEVSRDVAQPLSNENLAERTEMDRLYNPRFEGYCLNEFLLNGRIMAPKDQRPPIGRATNCDTR